MSFLTRWFRKVSNSFSPRLSRLRINALNRETRKTMRRSFLVSQLTCRSDRRVSLRSGCVNDARHCSLRSGRFSSGLHMSFCGTRGHCPRRGTNQSRERRGWSLGPFCMWHSGRSSFNVRLTFNCRRILFARRMMQIPYSWKGNREGLSVPDSLICYRSLISLRSEKTLKEVLKKQRDMVEEIKKKTNYYNTRNLIEKYDEPSSFNSGDTPLRKRNIPTPPMPQTPLVSQPQPQQYLQTPNGQVRGPLLQLSRACRSSITCHTDT